MKQFLWSDAAVLASLGTRLAARRLQAGLTQAELARQAGVGRSTVERMEAGQSTQLSSFLRVLRVLDLLEDFHALIPEPGQSPMELVRGKRRPRQRAAGRRKSPATPDTAWTWGDDA